MRGVCEIKKCSNPNLTKKIHEDFESLIYNICWECGNRLNQKFGDSIHVFKKIIEVVHEELA